MNLLISQHTSVSNLNSRSHNVFSAPTSSISKPLEKTLDAKIAHLLQQAEPFYQNQKTGLISYTFSLLAAKNPLDSLKDRHLAHQSHAAAQAEKTNTLVLKIIQVQQEEESLASELKNSSVDGIKILQMCLDKGQGQNLHTQLNQKRLERHHLTQELLATSKNFLETENTLTGTRQADSEAIRREITSRLQADIANIEKSYAAALKNSPQNQVQLQVQHAALLASARHQLAEFEQQFKALNADFNQVLAQNHTAIARIQQQEAPLSSMPSLSTIHQWVSKKMQHLKLMRNVQNGQINLEDMSRVSSAIVDFALQHPNQKIFRMMNNVSILFNQLKGEENIDLFWQTLLTMPAICAINGVDALTDLPADIDISTLSDKEKEEWQTIEQFCQLMEDLPYTIALVRGFDAGSSYGLERMGAILDGLGIPFLPTALTLGDGILGAQNRVNVIHAAQSLPEQSTSTIDHFIRFYFALNKEHSNLEQLRSESDSLRTFRATLVDLPNGKLPTFNLGRKIKNFALQIKHADTWQERALRILGQAIVPAFVALFVIPAVTALCVGLPPLGIALTAILITGGSIGIVNEGFGVYSTARVFKEWIDFRFNKTNTKVEQSIREEIFEKALHNKAHQETLKQAITKAQDAFKERVEQGHYDEILMHHAAAQKTGQPSTLTPATKSAYLAQKRTELVAQELPLIQARMTTLARIYLHEKVHSKESLEKGDVLRVDNAAFAAHLVREVELMDFLTPVQREGIIHSSNELKGAFQDMQKDKKHVAALPGFADFFKNNVASRANQNKNTYHALFNGIDRFKQQHASHLPQAASVA